MECPKCGHALADKKKTCMYCGASLQSQASNPKLRWVGKKRHVVVTDKRGVKRNLEDLPEHLRHKVEAAMRKGKGKVIVQEERTLDDTFSTGARDKLSALPLEKALNLLSKMRESCNHGDIDYDVYERMAAGIIKDYVLSLDDDMRTGFALNGITESDLSGYLTDDMLRDLRALVLASDLDEE